MTANALRRNSTAHINALLQPNETLVRVARVSAGIYWKGIAMLILAGLVMILIPIALNLGIFLMLVALIILIFEFLTKRYLLLMVTDKRILTRHGIIQFDVTQVRLSKIESVEVEWTLMGRLLGFANVVITGTGSRITVVPFIADAEDIRQALDAQLAAQEEKPLVVTPV